MKAYFAAVMLTAVVSSLASAMAAEGKTKKYVGFALSCLTALVILSPLSSLRELSFSLPPEWEFSLPEPEERGSPVADAAETSVADAAETSVAKAAEDALAGELCRRFRIPPEELAVEVSERERRISVVLAPAAAVYRDAVLRFLTAEAGEGVGCEVTVREE